MQSVEAAPATRLVDRYHLCFALGKANEDRGRHQESFRYYESRWTPCKRSRPLSAGAFRAQHGTPTERQVCTRAFFEGREGFRSSECRSDLHRGTAPPCRVHTARAIDPRLRIRALEGTHELADIQRMAMELQGRDPDLGQPALPPRARRELKAEDLLRLGENYLSDTRDLPHGARTLLHRQDAEQLPAHRPDSPAAAERPHHRRAA